MRSAIPPVRPVCPHCLDPQCGWASDTWCQYDLAAFVKYKDEPLWESDRIDLAERKLQSRLRHGNPPPPNPGP